MEQISLRVRYVCLLCCGIVLQNHLFFCSLRKLRSLQKETKFLCSFRKWGNFASLNAHSGQGVTMRFILYVVMAIVVAVAGGMLYGSKVVTPTSVETVTQAVSYCLYANAPDMGAVDGCFRQLHSIVKRRQSRLIEAAHSADVIAEYLSQKNVVVGKSGSLLPIRPSQTISDSLREE